MVESDDDGIYRKKKTSRGVPGKEGPKWEKEDNEDDAIIEVFFSRGGIDPVAPVSAKLLTPVEALSRRDVMTWW